MKNTDLAWAAGFVDGEGSFTVFRKRKAVQFSVTQLDRRSLDRLKRVLGVGKIYGPYAHSQKPRMHYFKVHSIRQIRQVIRCLWPWLGVVKRSDARRLLRFKGGL